MKVRVGLPYYHNGWTREQPSFSRRGPIEGQVRTRIAILFVSVLFAGNSIDKVDGQRSSTSSRTRVSEPIFGITYDYTKVHYEPVPAALRKTCGGFEVGTYWTFAHFEKGGRAYYVVLGVWPDQDGDSLGNAIEIDGSKCTIDESTWMLSGFVPSTGYLQVKNAPELPGLNAKEICDQGALGSCHYLLRSAAEEETLRALVDDAIKRGILAWGGDASFKHVACVPTILKGQKATPIVQQALEQYCSSSR